MRFVQQFVDPDTLRVAGNGLHEEAGPTSHCWCGAVLVTEAEQGRASCDLCEARAFAKWDGQRRRDADAALTTSCPSLTPALRAELLDAGLRPWQAVTVNALVRMWQAEPNNRMDRAGREADLRARIIAHLGAIS